MKHYIYIIGVLFCFTSCKNNEAVKSKTDSLQTAGNDLRNPANETEKAIYTCGDAMTKAFAKRDWSTIAEYTHPNVVKMMGGKEGMIEIVKAGMKDIPDTAIKKIGIGKIIGLKGNQCVIEQEMLMHLQGVSVSSVTYLVGESFDNGKNWRFFDASSVSGTELKQIMPNYDSSLTIPTPKRSVKQL